MRHVHVRTRWSSVVLLAMAALTALAACADPAGPRAGPPTPVIISGILTPEQRAVVAAMSVEVTGPGIGTPIVSQLDVGATSVNGTVQVPAGPDRTFTVRAFDATGAELYRGSSTVRIDGGDNPPLLVRLLPRVGSVPIDVTIGGFALTITPDSSGVAVGSELTLIASVGDGAGGSVGDGVVQWGALNPTLVRLTPSANGRSVTVRGLIAGKTRVVAVFNGVAAAAVVSVGGSTGGGTLRWTRIAAGAQHTCALTSEGIPYCWGRNEDGQLGDGTLVDRSVPVRVGGAGGPTFVTIGTGYAHSCGITAGGTVYCWGSNSTGQLGDGTTQRRTTPTPVPSITVAELTLGDVHTCAWSHALGDDRGPVWCWGDNSSGQLGDGTTTSRSTPTPLAGGWSGGRGLSAGGAHTCGFLIATGGTSTVLRCWGSNDFRQIDGTTTYFRTTPTALDPSPNVVTLTSGTWHVCGLDAVGAATCWGLNQSGQLGFSSGTSSAPQPVSGGHLFTTIDAGDRTTCGRTAAGEAWCWGANDQGQLGTGTLTASTTPVQVNGPALSSVTIGDAHACGVDAAGAAWCWGANAYGQLGDASTVRRTTPVRVSQP